MARTEQTPLIARPGETITFGFERTARQVGYRYKEFKKFARFIATYDDGHVIIGRAYPDGHFEYRVRVR